MCFVITYQTEIGNTCTSDNAEGMPKALGPPGFPSRRKAYPFVYPPHYPECIQDAMPHRHAHEYGHCASLRRFGGFPRPRWVCTQLDSKPDLSITGTNASSTEEPSQPPMPCTCICVLVTALLKAEFTSFTYCHQEGGQCCHDGRINI